MVANLIAAGRDAIERWGPVCGAAVGVPGLFDDRSGTIEFLPNLPGPWKGEPMTVPLTESLGVPVAIINDARAFTLAESRVGAAAGCETVAALVLGTGIGGGVVVAGRLHFGRMGRAGELSHQVIVPGGPPCTCGNHGCLEAVAAAGAITHAAGTATVHDAFAAAADGDERAEAAIAEVVDYIAIAIANIVTVLVPERVVIGGGVAEAGEALLGPLARPPPGDVCSSLPTGTRSCRPSSAPSPAPSARRCGRRAGRAGDLNRRLERLRRSPATQAAAGRSFAGAHSLATVDNADLNPQRTAPSVTPATIWRWNTTYTATIGRVMMLNAENSSW